MLKLDSPDDTQITFAGKEKNTPVVITRTVVGERIK